MTVLQALPAFEDNYIWCYRGNEGGSIVVDPGDAGPVLAAIADGLRIEAIFITHHHNDHTGGNLELKEKYGCVVTGPRADHDRIAGQQSPFLFVHSLSGGDRTACRGINCCRVLVVTITPLPRFRVSQFDGCGADECRW